MALDGFEVAFSCLRLRACSPQYPRTSYISASPISCISLFHRRGVAIVPVPVCKPPRRSAILPFSHIKYRRQPPKCPSLLTIIYLGRSVDSFLASFSVSVWFLGCRLTCCICYRHTASDFAVSISARSISHRHLLYLLFPNCVFTIFFSVDVIPSFVHGLISIHSYPLPLSLVRFFM